MPKKLEVINVKNFQMKTKNINSLSGLKSGRPDLLQVWSRLWFSIELPKQVGFGSSVF